MYVGYRWLPVNVTLGLRECIWVTELFCLNHVMFTAGFNTSESPVSRTYTTSSLSLRFSQAENEIEQSLVTTVNPDSDHRKLSLYKYI